MALSIQQQIVNEAVAQGVDPSVALAIANQESGFNQAAVGTSGEVGVFQLMPATAASVGVTDRTNLSQNIYGGIAYFKQMLNQFGGNVAQALAAYNAGPGAVTSGRIPSSTQSYVSKILGVLGIGSSAPPASSQAGALIPSPIEPSGSIVPGGVELAATSPLGISSGVAIAAATGLLLLLFA